ncbi:hypothetical protein FSP39_008771 [Pinctada imbricata]|uniref:Uncharacterized protein n=1 Tax=Pinctada imbricata TaxID=66713 RepID=A0AA88XEW9_PINIB|nr:hypothetical protein FSP39_008771 [Pinctada imbricata]
MGNGLNIASPYKRYRQFSSTDNISNAGRGRGRRGHRGQGQGRGRGGHGNINRTTAEIESYHDEVDDLGLDENEVFEFVVKECGGMVKLSNLVDKCQLFPSGSDEARVGQWFKTHRRRFLVFQDRQEVVYVAPFFKNATYCLDYARKQCYRENCDHFHICQHYMRGTCRKGDTCPKSHSFTNDHNLEHKIKLGLDGFSEIDMCIILLNRYPQICPERYCKEDKRCPYLHICQRFISKNCKFGEKCRKGHTFDTEHNSWILNRIYHMEKWDKSEDSTFRNIISFPRRLRRSSRHDSGSSKQDDMDSLADHHLSSECFLSGSNQQNSSLKHSTFGQCKLISTRKQRQKVKGRKPVRRKGGRLNPEDLKCRRKKCLFLTSQRKEEQGEWTKIEENRASLMSQRMKIKNQMVSIEATEYKLHVCLDTELNTVVYEVASFPVQQAEHVLVRRLSTPSYADKRANRPQHSVKKRKDRLGRSDGMQFTLEKKFICNQKTYLFAREDYIFKYKISFDKMEQINLDTGKTRRLLRRPLFVSRDDVSSKTFPQCLSVTISPGTPSHWAPLDMSGAEFELVELERTKEFTRVQDSFYATLDRQVYEIDLIYRVQSRSLWNEYFMKKKMMNEKAESEASGRTVDERDLFHGTDSLETCRKICTNSFDFRISGKNATVYGEGSYFALESDYSNRYTNKTSGSRLMFRAKVLVGKCTKGERSFKRPPEIPGGSHKLYDSCVNDTANPTIFIIFDTRQCYPEYLIQYHKKGEEMLVGDVYVPPQPRPASVSSFSNTASSSNNASVSSRPVVSPRIGKVSTNVSSPFAAFSDPYGQVPSRSQSGVRTHASYSQGQSAMQTQAHSQDPVSQSPFSTQPYSQDNSQFHGSPLDYQNVYYSRSAAEGDRYTPTQTYRTASGREVPTPSYRRKEEGCVLQ